jgi:hypothetical protein
VRARAGRSGRVSRPDLAGPEALVGRPRPGLPASFSSFIGREDAVREIKRLLAGARLLTLVGSGGVGKTRLALQVAGEFEARNPDGVWLVELAPLEDGARVARAVADALDLHSRVQSAAWANQHGLG